MNHNAISIRTMIIIFFIVLFPILGQAQSKWFKDTFIDAEYAFMYEEFKKALPMYLQLYKKDSTNANINYRIGSCYLHIAEPNDKINALPYLERAITNMTHEYDEGSYRERHAPYDALFYLGNVYRALHRFDEAIAMYERFKKTLEVDDIFYIDFIKREIQATRNAKELVKFPVKLEVESISDSINSDTTIENCPVISDDEKTMVFTQGNKNNFSGDVDLSDDPDYQTDNIFCSKKVNWQWEKPVNITSQLSSKHAKMVPTSLSADGKDLYIIIDKNDNGDVYVSHYENGKWSKAKKLNKNINTRYWESHACISVDGKSLYFTSDRPGGYGGLDIYVSHKNEKGEWGKAKNLGKTINSKYDEETPFILDDGKTLYFSSQGHYCMGGFDVFHSKLMENGKWSTPLNLGYPINTVGNDLFYIPKFGGEYAFFPLNNNDRKIGGNDIYAIKITPPDSQATEITIKGTITLQDRKPEYPKDLSVFIINKETGDTTKKITPNLTNGIYEGTVSEGSYQVLFQASDYYPITKEVFVPRVYTRSDIVINIEMIPMEVAMGEFFVIKNILFDYGKYDLKRDGMIELEKLANLMLQNPGMYVEVVGHTDSKGSSSFNKKLSEKRAQAVVDYLTQKGLSRERFVAKGVGEEQPIAINQNEDGSDNPEGRQLNRRVELKIIKTDSEIFVKHDVYIPPELRYHQGNKTHNKRDAYTILLAKTTQPQTFSAGITVKSQKIGNTYYYTTQTFRSKSDAMLELNKLKDKYHLSKAKLISTNKLRNIKTTNQLVVNNEHSNDVGKDDLFYSVQLLAVRHPIPLSYFKNLKRNEIKEHYFEDSIFRYTYRKVRGIDNAEQLKAKLIAMGYTDAFVVKYDKYRQLDKSVSARFGIQVASTSAPAALSKFKNLSGVHEFIGKDGQYKYVWGSFRTPEAARRNIDKLKKKGYTDAFIVNLNQFK